MIRNTLYRIQRTAALLLASIASAASMSAQVAPAVRTVTTPIDNADRVSLSGSMRPDVKLAADHGAASPSLTAHHVNIVLHRSAERQAALDQYLSDVQNPKSAVYHHWLTPLEYGTQFGAAASDVQTIVGWLQSQGLNVEHTSPAANTITFSGTVGQLESAFSVTMHSLSVHGEMHVANTSEPHIPRAFAAAVNSVVGLDDFHPRPTVRQGPSAKYNATSHRIEPDFTLFDSAGNPYLYVDPADAATIYDTPNSALNTAYKGPSYDGTGITVGVVGDSDVDLSPVSNYRTAFLGETTATLNLPTIIVDGSDPGTNGDELESWLDLEVLGGLAPKAKINYYTSNDSDISAGLFNAIERAINDNAVSILSISYGACEANEGTATTQFIGELYQQAAAQGITVTVSSGDSGSAGCDSDGLASATQGLGVNALGSSPYNISVGGTDYDVLGTSFSSYVVTANSGIAPYYETALSYIPEEPWNDSTVPNGALASNTPFLPDGNTDIIAGGGGESIVYTKPAFQTALTPADGARDMPDVAFLAGNGLYGAVWLLCETSIENGPDCTTSGGQFTSSSRFDGAGGTSAATPAFAGMLALIEQATGSRLGNANNVIYNLAASNYSTVFHDITTGNNSVVCTAGSPSCGSNGFTTGYDAGTGYDFASGLGSVDAAVMLANWSSAVGTSSTLTLTINGAASPVSVVHGTTLNFAVGVTPTTATGFAGLITTATAATGAPTLNGQTFTIPVTNGIGTGSYNGLPGGQYTVYANYGGDTTTAASESSPINVNISAEPSSTQLSVNAYTAPAQMPLSNLSAVPYGSFLFGETSVYGTAEGFTASLGLATGSLNYFDNGTAVGTAPITSGNLASFPSTAAGVYPYTVGTHSLTAKYSGDASYSANTSNPTSFTVVKGATGITVTPATASVLYTGSDNVVVNITTASMGSAPTGTLTLTSNGSTLATSSALSAFNYLDGTAGASFTFNIQGSQLIIGGNQLTATYSGDSNYTGSAGKATVTMAESTFKLTTTAIGIPTGASVGNTATVTATSFGGFAGLVNLSCAVTSIPAAATSPISCNVPASIDLTGLSPTITTLTVNSSATTTGGAYVVTIIGADAATGKVTSSTTSTVTVTGTPAINLGNSGPITFTAGATSGNTSTLTVTPVNAYAGAVTLACSVTTVPSGAVDPVTCAVTPASVTLSGTSVSTATLTISSTTRTTASLFVPTFGGVGGTVLAISLFCFVPGRRRRQWSGLFLLTLLISLGALAGCSGSSTPSSSSTGTPTPTGTTAGAYVVTVTATPAGAATQTVTVDVTVN